MLRRETGPVPLRPDVAYGDLPAGDRRQRHRSAQKLPAALAVGTVDIEQVITLDSRVV